MKVKLSKAVKMFFGNSSLEMVYFEAIANALDADANKISIKIFTQAYNQPETLKVEIEDNGIGFTDERFSKFCNLFDVEESSHKGLGRLVYLCYFGKILVQSYFNNDFCRNFEFSNDFDEKSTVVKSPSTINGTKFSMSNYVLSRLGQYNYIQPKYLKSRILEEFYPRLYQLKQENKEITITINLEIENQLITETLSTNDIPNLEKIELDYSVSAFDKIYLYYSIEASNEPSIITAISVDNRSQKIEIIAKENIPLGYKMIFLLYSDWFIGKVDHARQNLDISESDMQQIKYIFRNKVSQLISEKIPKIAESNKKVKISLISRYPHLNGYFEENCIGFSSRAELLKRAQDKFFKAQRDILDANSLTEEQYSKALELSSRTLTEYILFRQLSIENLKKINNKSLESDIHSLIIPMKQEFTKDDFSKDLYRNNAWILDDKYMTYSSILSDKEMTDVVRVITEGEIIEKDNDRPDIAIVFSNDPNKDKVVDVVIVELKKKGLTHNDNMKVITQLETRARRLMKYYKNKIQRIWFYGIIEFNDEIELALMGEYTELYSTGKMFYKETTVAIQKDPKITLPVGIFIMDLNSLINDADARNSTFLNIIKNKILQSQS
ncbi:ATP-binding protein [Barnesiella propionica]|uniref:ATP-binding protein n=1 Tax=Barnesiella propionica TaxID=2981781 RepID=UPI0011C6F1A9|nr:ATP-binding protein [Barnesiella propionica]MCU6769334.1 ATP-binding protein [Barnesiella propionica]